MSTFTIPKEETNHVYSMFCRDGDGPIYVKFGRSKNITSRLSSLRTACPIPAKWFATIEARSYRHSRVLEKAFHEQFADRRISGEWYKFDLDLPEDKRAFNDGSRAVIRRHLGSDKRHWWSKLSVPALDAYNKTRKALFLKSKNKEKILFRVRQESRRKATWKELAAYRGN